MDHKYRKHDLSVPRMKEYSSQSKTSRADFSQVREETHMDEIKARTASTLLHLTFG
jgi:hypothetical protein